MTTIDEPLATQTPDEWTIAALIRLNSDLLLNSTRELKLKDDKIAELKEMLGKALVR